MPLGPKGKIFDFPDLGYKGKLHENKKEIK